jgi:hypothetical protein
MGPGRFGGLGPSGAAVLATFVVAVAVMAIVSIGGGLDRPLVVHSPHVAAAHAPPSQG